MESGRTTIVDVSAATRGSASTEGTGSETEYMATECSAVVDNSTGSCYSSRSTVYASTHKYTTAETMSAYYLYTHEIEHGDVGNYTSSI